ncbi:ankyrin repeat domain-containing protein [Legionella spiritensis]|uniref:ankyrin repeat domain-containing protein n=1 Tax=Legionella spiritensis TaxID=452 RepID=UPI000F6F642B|nr:ankyrin repeat domain-containing protein [Legionella spiritensis]VEG90229.1 Ankyrin repeats (3 copies) [Legionella spiritensis]
MYRFHQSPRAVDEENNNELHKAILARDSEACLALIDSMSEDELNAVSLGNSPALLAIKTGLIDVAAKLVEMDEIDIHVMDNRGFTLLHYACYLREDDLIRKLIARNARVFALHVTNNWLPDTYIFWRAFLKATHPATIYEKKGIWWDTWSEIIDTPGFFISPNLVLTNLVFHTKAICLNYDILPAEAFEKADVIPRSADQFVAYCRIGMEPFLQYRNKKPVAEEILSLLNGKEKVINETYSP